MNKDKALYKEATQQFTLRSYIRSLPYIIIMIGLFFTPLVLLNYIDSYVAVTLIAYVFYGGFQYYALVATHEAIHYGLWPNRKINNILGAITAATHTFNFSEVKKIHLKHHRNIGQPIDPDYPFYIKRNRAEKFSIFSIALKPLKLFENLFSGHREADTKATENLDCNPRKDIHHILAFHAILLIILAIIFWPLSIAWALALISIPGFLMQIRLITEHSGLIIEGEELPNAKLLARTHEPPKGLLSQLGFHVFRYTIAPFNFNYHHEHHTMPGIPYYCLQRAHIFLKNNAYYDDKPAQCSASYVKTFKENFRL